VPIDAETTSIMDDLEAHFLSGGVDVERDETHITIRVKLNDMDNHVITCKQPIKLTVFRDRVDAEYVEDYSEPQPDHQAVFDGDAVLTIAHTEAVRVKLTYDLSKEG